MFLNDFIGNVWGILKWRISQLVVPIEELFVASSLGFGSCYRNSNQTQHVPNSLAWQPLINVPIISTGEIRCGDNAIMYLFYWNSISQFTREQDGGHANHRLGPSYIKEIVIEACDGF